MWVGQRLLEETHEGRDLDYSEIKLWDVDTRPLELVAAL